MRFTERSAPTSSTPSTPSSWRSSKPTWPSARPAAARSASSARPRPSSPCWRRRRRRRPMLRDSILAAIGQVRPLPPPEPETARRGDRSAAPAVAAPEAVDELAVRRLSRRSRFLSLAVAAALVVALALGGWGFSQAQGRQAQIAEAALETQLYTAPDVKIVATTTSNGAQVSFVSSKQPEQGALRGQRSAAHRGGQALPAVDAQGDPAVGRQPARRRDAPPVVQRTGCRLHCAGRDDRAGRRIRRSRRPRAVASAPI